MSERSEKCHYQRKDILKRAAEDAGRIGNCIAQALSPARSVKSCGFPIVSVRFADIMMVGRLFRLRLKRRKKSNKHGLTGIKIRVYP